VITYLWYYVVGTSRGHEQSISAAAADQRRLQVQHTDHHRLDECLNVKVVYWYGLSAVISVVKPRCISCIKAVKLCVKYDFHGRKNAKHWFICELDMIADCNVAHWSVICPLWYMAVILSDILQLMSLMSLTPQVDLIKWSQCL